MVAEIRDQTVAEDELQGFIERIERLTEEKKGFQDDIKDVFAEAKSMGYVPSAMRRMIRLRAMEKAAREEQEALDEVYKHALKLD